MNSIRIIIPYKYEGMWVFDDPAVNLVREPFVSGIDQISDRQKTAGGAVHSTTRDASGRIIVTATTRPNSGGNSQTTYRDASGRLTGSASTQGTASGSSRTTYRDASGRSAGSASTSKVLGSGTPPTATLRAG